MYTWLVLVCFWSNFRRPIDSAPWSSSNFAKNGCNISVFAPNLHTPNSPLSKNRSAWLNNANDSKASWKGKNIYRILENTQFMTVACLRPDHFSINTPNKNEKLQNFHYELLSFKTFSRLPKLFSPFHCKNFIKQSKDETNAPKSLEIKTIINLLYCRFYCLLKIKSSPPLTIAFRRFLMIDSLFLVFQLLV